MVTFIDERRKMRIPQRVKPKEAAEIRKKKPSFKGAASVLLASISSDTLFQPRANNAYPQFISF